VYYKHYIIIWTVRHPTLPRTAREPAHNNRQGSFEINLEALVHSTLETTDTAVLSAAGGCLRRHTLTAYTGLRSKGDTCPPVQQMPAVYGTRGFISILTKDESPQPT
jgi:hypothetical protein